MRTQEETKKNLELMSLVSQTPTSLINAQGETLYCPIVEKHHFWPAKASQYILEQFASKQLPEGIPYIHTFEKHYILGVIPLSNDLYAFIGPANIAQVSIEDTIAAFQDIIPRPEILYFYSLYEQSIPMDYFRFAGILAEINNYNHDSLLSGPEILNHNFQAELEPPPAPDIQYGRMAGIDLDAVLMFQRALYSDVREGNMDALMRQWRTPAANNLQLSFLSKEELVFFYTPFYTFLFQGALKGGANPQICFEHYLKQIQRFQNITNSAEGLAELERSAIEYCKLVIDSKQNSNIMPEICATCVKYINDHIHEKINITQLSRLCGIYKNKLYSIFRSHFGMTIGEYIEYERLRRSMVYLESSDYTIAEIASTMGYASQSHFTQIFKKRFGCTPRQYQKNPPMWMYGPQDKKDSMPDR